ncbi:MAG TPA: polyphosphate polymerase domain-containing protein [Myxococcales bacterium]|nr:polyphosphate polymerase domain-containing protein [Myxococcales bacterium]
MGSKVMPSFQTKFERLELKFLVEESHADSIRKDISTLCKSDAYNGIRENGSLNQRGYPIYSCYLDSPAMAFHRAKERGDSHRLKLRIRTYSETSLASLEIKRRHSAVIYKTRTAIDRDLVEKAARGYPVGSVKTQSAQSVLSDFSRIAAKSGAEPTLTVHYRREAYESLVDNYARVTFDRKIKVQAATDWSLNPHPGGWHSFDEYWEKRSRISPVVLELKCETTPPLWMVELIRKHQLESSSFSKYSIGVGLCDENWGLGRKSSRRSLKALG